MTMRALGQPWYTYVKGSGDKNWLSQTGEKKNWLSPKKRGDINR